MVTVYSLIVKYAVRKGLPVFVCVCLQVLTTHYILDTLQPQWERGVELFVADFTEV